MTATPLPNATILGYPRQRVHETLQLLAGWQLATHQPHTGWTLGPANPDTLARHLGGWTDWHNQHRRHQQHRAAWHTWLDRHQPTPGITGQLHLELATALTDNNDQWIAEYANGTSPPHTPATALEA